MSSTRTRNLPVLILAGMLIASTSGLVVYAPTLYRMFCNLTGFGGTVQRAAAPKPKTTTTGRAITVYFDANVAPGLPWTFRPEQRKVTIRPGETAKVYYYAKNNSPESVIARATFNVTPYKAAPYFFKIECFCFTEEKLGPGESARMPLVLYVDEQLVKDANTRDVRNITLSYTFFKQTGLSAEKIKRARDLKAGSAKTDAKLKRSEKVGFDNDAPRR